MNRNIVALTLLVLFSELMFLTEVGAQSRYSKSIQGIFTTVETFHLRPREVDDDFAQLVFDQTLKSLDPSGFVFTKEDYSALESMKGQMLQELKRGGTSFPEKLIELYMVRMDSVRSQLDAIDQSTMDFNLPDSMRTSEKSRYVSEEERLKKWHHWSKFQVLVDLLSKDSTDTKESFDADEVKLATNRIVARTKCALGVDRAVNKAELEEHVYLDYIKAIANAFDPHTNYFTASEERQFASLISNESKSFGIDIELGESGYAEVAYVLPGGPAWNSNQVNEGDLIVAITVAGKPEIEGFCSNISFIADFLNDPKVEGASFKLEKPGGRQLDVQLNKEAVNVSENNIQSFVLSGEHRVGYIYLPSFYTNEAEGMYQLPNGCANDVAKELLQLQGEGIKSLILDLRDNTGGSMLEAIRLAGLFIDQGTLGIAQYRGEDPESLKDLDRGVVTNLPLLVMVNEFSASASELFSAAIQDHNRGIVVGANSFGKSTIQQVLPIAMQSESTEFLKVTLGEFYRTNGEPIQQLGIAPDIEFPGFYDRDKHSEKAYPSSLTSQKVEKETYYEPLAPIDLTELKRKSEERIKADKAFAELDVTKDKPKETYVPLQLPAFAKYYRQHEEEDTAAAGPNSAFELLLPSYKELYAMIDPKGQVKLENMQAWMDEDLYLKETFRISIDLVNNLKR